MGTAVPGSEMDLTSSSLSSLTGLVSSHLLGVDLLPVIHSHISGDSTLSKILDSPSHFKNFSVDDGLIYLCEDGCKLLCMPENV